MFEPIQNKSNYQHIVDQIKQLVLDNKLSIGDKLPTERELSELYQVSRASVREALKALEALGLVEVRHGEGNFIINNLKTQFTDSLSLVVALEHYKLEYLTDLRYALEFNTMRHIILDNDPDSMAALTSFAEKIKNSTSIEEIATCDLEFHTLIAHLTQNPLEKYIQQSIQMICRKHLEYLNHVDSSWNNFPLDEAKKIQLDIINVLLNRDLNHLNDALTAHYYQYPTNLDLNKLYDSQYEDYSSGAGNPEKNQQSEPDPTT